MRFIVCLLTALALISCRTTKDEDKRVFAEAQSSNEGIAGVTVKQRPEPKPVEAPPSPFPQTADPIENGAFYRLCVARDQLSPEQALTLKAMLAAMHQSTCADGERWLRDSRNTSLMIESEELVEWQSLRILQNYPLIRNIYITLAKGVEAVCPLVLPQICHFRTPEF